MKFKTVFARSRDTGTFDNELNKAIAQLEEEKKEIVNVTPLITDAWIMATILYKDRITLSPAKLAEMRAKLNGDAPIKPSTDITKKKKTTKKKAS